MSGADAIMPAIAGDLDTFYNLTSGSLEPIGLLFTDIAGQPVPPNMLVQLLDIPEEQMKAAIEKKEHPVATKEQLIEAISKSIDPDDAVDKYSKIFKIHIDRLANAKKVMAEIAPKLTAFHKSCNGSLAKVEAFFCDLAPEPHKGKPMPPGMINALVRVPNENTECSLNDFLSCVERNMDPTDSADSFADALATHTV